MGLMKLNVKLEMNKSQSDDKNMNSLVMKLEWIYYCI